MRLGGQTVTVINNGTQTATGRLGEAVYGAQVWTVVNNCSVQEHQTKREISLTDVVEARYRLFAPASAPLTATSQVVVNGVTYIVDGQPAFWQNNSGTVDHIECYIRAQAG